MRESFKLMPCRAVLAFVGVFASTAINAQEYLGEYTGMACRGLGGKPDSTITDDENPDPVRGCWRYYKVLNPATGQMDPAEEKPTCEQPCVAPAN